MLLVLREPIGERVLAEADLPASLGGEGSDVTVSSRIPGPLAWLGIQDGRYFLQVAGDESLVLQNGAACSGSTWISDGDVIDVADGRLKFHLQGGRHVLEVLAGGAANVTAPPVPEPSAGVAGSGAPEDASIEAVAFRRPGADAPGRRRAFPWGRIATVAGLVLLALVAAVIFTSVPVQLRIEPTPERASFQGGWPGLRFGSSHLLRPGSYRLVAEREGYERLEVPVEIADRRDQRLEFSMKLLPGRLRVETPVPGRLSVDGVEAGEVPGEFELAAGRHRLTIDTERYLDHVEEVEIDGGGRLQLLRPELAPGWAVVSVVSEPADAELLVNGEQRGRTPLEFELMAGSYRLELRRAGYKPWLTDLQVQPGTPVEIGPVKLGVPDGRLVVRTRPAGANVTIGGAYRGRTPLEIEVRPDIVQAISISREGYESASRELSVASGSREVVDVKLQAILGQVIVSASPADAELYVDGEPRGRANQTLELPATAHVIELRKSGYAPYRETVTPRPGLPQKVEARLLEAVASAAAPSDAAGSEAGDQAAAPPAMVALEPTLRSPAGQELKLAPAGSYTMGSPRREAGRRANESQRAVSLQRRFYIATREVTNAEYRQFRPQHRSGYILQTTLDLDRQPVVNVSWQDAAAYCNWLSEKEGLPPAYRDSGGRLVAVDPATNGYRLPTEAEWEWVARRGTAGLLKYPWGENLPVPQGSGNFADRRAQPIVPLVLDGLDDGYAGTAPVASFSANALGIFDLGGNVAEWTHDLYTVRPPGGEATVDPAATGEGSVHVIRGSSWKHAAVTELRLAYRDYGEGKRNDVGFRIARYAQ
ncbi:MAG TPA: PEGA domain-containing protein [Steroidobacteraceae bacterium]|nr:PEGA domain-containing protein [Steroidobacteraceae bacterium]